MTYDQAPHLLRDIVYDAEQEHLLVKNGINPRIAKAVVTQTRMEQINQPNIQTSERERSNDSTD